jgi:hypothetical protein
MHNSVLHMAFKVGIAKIMFCLKCWNIRFLLMYKLSLRVYKAPLSPSLYSFCLALALLLRNLQCIRLYASHSISHVQHQIHRCVFLQFVSLLLWSPVKATKQLFLEQRIRSPSN